jgi:uncharacterized protein YcbK (DUF882 family)
MAWKLLIQVMNISRRQFALSLIVSPAMVEAAPLIDLEKGSGMFSFSNGRLEKGSVQFTNKISEDQKSSAFRSQLAGLTRLRNNHTGEEIVLNSKLIFSQSERVNWFFRDWREKKSIAMDPSVVLALTNICGDQRFEKRPEVVYIHSGYRTRKTNDMLRSQSNGVAKKSLHVLGKAIDFSIPGFSPSLIASIAREVLDGGVGHYDGFVHIDTGPKREWRG